MWFGRKGQSGASDDAYEAFFKKALRTPRFGTLEIKESDMFDVLSCAVVTQHDFPILLAIVKGDTDRYFTRIIKVIDG